MQRYVAILTLIAAALAAFVFVYRMSSVPSPAQPNTYISGASPVQDVGQAYLLPLAQPAYAPIRDSTVSDPIIDANAATIIDSDSGRVLYERNATTQVPIASLTKLLTALVVRDLFPSDEIVTITSASLRIDGLKQTLYEDERLRVRDLMGLMLVQSSNDAASALAVHARQQGIDLIARMNAHAQDIGMRDCRFTDPAGLDDTAFCTARDLVRLVRAALRSAPELWPIMASPHLTVRSLDGRIVHEAVSTNELFDTVPGIVGGKTGNTDGALGCMLMVVKSPGSRATLISIVLGSRQRFTDTAQLVSWAQRAYQWQ